MNIETEINRELWNAVARSYQSQSWANSILDAVHFLADSIRSKTGLQSDGIALVAQAFGGKAPKLLLNKLQTETDKNVQSGVEQLIRGLFQAIRNPRSHERVDDSQAEANAIIIFVNYLLGIIGHAKNEFSLDEYVGRVLEENFVPSARYAALLASEIPQKKKLEVALTVFRSKLDGNGKNLRFFFDVLLAELADDEKADFFSAVSEELRSSSSENELRQLLQLLNAKYWLNIAEAARLRTENRLISNISDGEYSRSSATCLSGGLGTWSRGFWQFFSLKKDLLRVLLGKINSSSSASRDYVVEYFLGWLDVLEDKPSPFVEGTILSRLKMGDQYFKERFELSLLWGGDKWSEEVKSALADFQAAKPEPALDLDDDIPF